MYLARVKLYHEAEGASAVATIQKKYHLAETAIYAVGDLTEKLTSVARTAGLDYDEVETRVFRTE